MSGGAMDYLHWKMENGETDAAANRCDQMLDELVEVARSIAAGERVSYINNASCAYPYPEDARVALAFARERLFRFKEKALELAGMAQELAPIAHAIEWDLSGDTGMDCVADECVKYMQREQTKGET